MDLPSIQLRQLSSDFYAKVTKTESCWLWSRYKLPRGYGRYRDMLAHRASWIITYGDIPDKLQVHQIREKYQSGITVTQLSQDFSCSR